LTLLLFTLLAGCGNGIRSKEKVQEAIISRLQARSGLDLATLDVTTTEVTFDKDTAHATVAFHPKGNVSVNSGMVMNYTLQERNGKWEVVSVGGTQAHGAIGKSTPPNGSGQLPPGHPSVDQMGR
jgi:hypothetical protein